MTAFKAYKELEGYFNKDEQGWCGYRIEVICEDENVTHRKYFDSNGTIESEEILKGTVTKTESEIVYITLQNGHLLEYSLKERKLILW